MEDCHVRQSERGPEVRDEIRRLLRKQRLCALSTDNRGQPYLSLVAFAESEDLSFVLFATTRHTRKFSYLSAQSRVAMLVDSRSNRDTDFHKASAVTILGEAAEVVGDERESLIRLYLDKHPHLVDFVSSPTCAVVKVKVDRYCLVTDFQNVTELVMSR